ncbi:hypothetical protein ACF0H5_020069 [Mactra antiquata]
MRPALTDTPPMSHVMSKILQPTPVLMCGLDWKNLTSDNSIQILDSSEYLLDDSLCHQSFISKHVKIVDRITNHQSEDERSIYEVTQQKTEHDVEYIGEKNVCVDSTTLPRGEILESRVIITPNGSTKKAPLSDKKDDISEVNSNQILKRTRYSDTDILRATPKRQANVARSRSVGWAESEKRGGDSVLLQPLQPSAYVTKISDVKRLPSSRPAKQNSANDSNVEYTSSIDEYKMSSTPRPEKGNHSSNLPLLQLSKINIAKLVKNGLKSVKHSKNVLQKVGQTEQYYNQQLKKHRRGVRYSSAIGGLSEFLRRTERRRKTLYDIPEVTTSDVISTQIVDTKSKFETSRDQSGTKMSENRCFTPQTPKTVHEKCTSLTGSLKFSVNQCQRKLCFDKHNKCDPNIKSAHKNVTMVTETTFDSVSTVQTRRPRLGVISSKENTRLMPIDGLEMEVVTNLKRIVDNKIRSTRIKTNGSLNRTKKLSQQKSSVCQSPIWRRSLRYNRVGRTKIQKVSRESVV